MRAGREADWMAISGISVQKLYHFPIIFLKGDCVVYLDEPGRLKERGETIELEFRESMVHRLEKGYLLPGQTELLYPAGQVLGRLQGPYSIMLTGLDQKLPGMKVNHKFSFDVKM